jgi:SAM-dependent methyltransferase
MHRGKIDMPLQPVDYDHIAPRYDERYRPGVEPLAGVSAVLHALAARATTVLEAGCGTGHWLAELQAPGRMVAGLDLSQGMLRQARAHDTPLAVTHGRAEQLPFAAGSFDLVVCVNALHHFARPAAFVAEAYRVGQPGGALAIAGMDPHAGRDHWYVYDYFPGTRETDLARFPSSGTLLDWLSAAGFGRAEWRPVEHMAGGFTGRSVFADPFLQQHGTSQLALLSADAYAAGLARLERAVATDEQARFATDLTLYLIVAYR